MRNQMGAFGCVSPAWVRPDPAVLLGVGGWGRGGGGRGGDGWGVGAETVSAPCLPTWDRQLLWVPEYFFVAEE